MLKSWLCLLNEGGRDLERASATIKNQAENMFEQLKMWRRRFHQHPELSFQEMDTSRFVVDYLNTLPGIQVNSGVGYQTAVTGTISSGSGPTIAIRVDMDALPIQEENDVDYMSKKEGVMHACGHDAHTAIGLGCASLMASFFQKGLIQGTVKLLFQPAEERADESGLTGAQHMIEGGVLHDVDAAIALHMNPEKPLGEMLIHDGYSMGNVDVFESTIYGSGGHGAYPHLGTDPLWMLNHVLTGIYSIPGRLISALDSAVISVGSIHAGAQNNVIPSEVKLSGTIRTYQPDVQEKAHAALQNIFSVVERLGGSYDLNIRNEDPALNNDARMNRFIRLACDELYPDFIQHDMPFGLGGEDFANVADKVPSAMFFLGCNTDYLKNGMLHTPTFDIAEDVLPVGVAILSLAAIMYLDAGGVVNG